MIPRADAVSGWTWDGRRLAEIRGSAGLSQTALADRIGTTQQHVSRLERGGSAPSADMLVRLAAALGVSTDALLGLEDAA